MILPSLILILIIGGIASWIAARRSPLLARWIAVASVLADLLVSLRAFGSHTLASCSPHRRTGSRNAV